MKVSEEKLRELVEDLNDAALYYTSTKEEVEGLDKLFREFKEMVFEATEKMKEFSLAMEEFGESIAEDEDEDEEGRS